MRVVVTGAAGMIGSNLVHGLNAIGIDDVIAVDDLSDGPKFKNLVGATLSDYFDRRDFYARFAAGELGTIACGLAIRDAMPIANRAGGIVVGKFGTATASYDELFGSGGPA